MSAERLTTLDVRKIDSESGREWTLTAPFIAVITLDGTEYFVRVPNGFVTDFASVPRIPLAFMLFGGIGEYAAVIHDWLYRTNAEPREICDAIFKEMLLHVDKTSGFRAWCMHRAVRIGGGGPYGNKS